MSFIDRLIFRRVDDPIGFEGSRVRGFGRKIHFLIPFSQPVGRRTLGGPHYFKILSDYELIGSMREDYGDFKKNIWNM
jgi:hypothetical protein